MLIVWEIPLYARELLLEQLERVRTQEGFRIDAGEPAWSELGGGILAIPTRVPSSARAYQALLFGLLAIDVRCREMRPYPSVLDNGRILYEPDASPGVESWPSTPALHLRGYGNCDAIACDRAAEWTVAGRPCAPLLELVQESDHVREFHVVVVGADGYREDPTQEIERRTPWQIRS